MSDENSTTPQPEQGKKSKGLIIALFAGVLGLLAGAGLYALSGPDGNVEVASNSCAFDEKLRTKLDAAAGGDVAAFRALDRPYSIAKLAFNDGAKTRKSFGDWQGKTTLVNLWATWCAPCRAEMPALDELQHTLGSDSFEVVAVSVDLGADAKPKKFYDDIGLKHLGFHHDPDMATLNQLKKDGLAFGLPATLLVNSSGCVLGTLNGPAEWAGDDAKKLVRAAF